jgi:hypothetical protein
VSKGLVGLLGADTQDCLRDNLSDPRYITRCERQWISRGFPDNSVAPAPSTMNVSWHQDYHLTCSVRCRNISPISTGSGLPLISSSLDANLSTALQEVKRSSQFSSRTHGIQQKRLR